MIITIKNDKIKLSVDTHGAQMMSLDNADGVQYLWNGDPTYWKNRAPVLFPFVGRPTDNCCTLHGKTYPMTIHGFAMHQEFEPAEVTDTSMTLVLRETPSTLEMYPFAFAFAVTYALQDSSVITTYHVENHSDTTMYFGVGGHPGFRVPLSPDEVFTDYVLEFSQPCNPDKVVFSPNLHISGVDEAYPLVDGTKIPLSHDLFDEDAIVLKNMDKTVTLYSPKSNHGVKATYPQMPYLGLWHKPKSDAPYVCIEPWTSLPAREGVIEEYSCKSDMISLLPNGQYDNEWVITIF